jgi:hypothetical protein
VLQLKIILNSLLRFPLLAQSSLVLALSDRMTIIAIFGAGNLQTFIAYQPIPPAPLADSQAGKGSAG